ncbi:MAG: hypothetical protein ACD_80C00131G0010 [uncultured bacterium (gcode 4)]|uniref:Uncharacterized protein n=1 Tax=uncultured bacterium (gcode 4) TaxID=1234023 RepID=K1XIK5_9BACT|nr:MAG: hypothetical protein ACD_80C00131G0010 [uncultured bacterium (gcode 4)]
MSLSEWSLFGISLNTSTSIIALVLFLLVSWVIGYFFVEILFWRTYIFHSSLRRYSKPWSVLTLHCVIWWIIINVLFLMISNWIQWIYHILQKKYIFSWNIATKIIEFLTLSVEAKLDIQMIVFAIIYLFFLGLFTLVVVYPFIKILNRIARWPRHRWYS